MSGLATCVGTCHKGHSSPARSRLGIGHDRLEEVHDKGTGPSKGAVLSLYPGRVAPREKSGRGTRRE